MQKAIWITPGDPLGIGPEVTQSALLQLQQELRAFEIYWVGRLPKNTAPALKAALPQLQWIEPPEAPFQRNLAGFQSGWAIETAARGILSRDPSKGALVTGPISKLRLNQGGFSFQGHTDFLAHLCGLDESRVTMMLTNSRLSVSLVTVHLPLQKVSSELSAQRLETTVVQTSQYLSQKLGKEKITLAVCALNPHCGEGGLLGREEIDFLIPALEELRGKPSLQKTKILGPFSADTLFTQVLQGEVPADGVIAQYHDQGLIPVKLIDFAETINVTLGLPFMRTSVDHGTADSIAGQGRADARSMTAALKAAIHWLN